MAETRGSHDKEELNRRLTWLTLVRIALVTLLLAASAMVVLRSDAEVVGTVEQVLYAVILAAYAASLVYLIVQRRMPGLHRRLAYAQVVGDVLISACLVYVTGGSESVLVFMFPITVVSAAVLLYRPGAIFSAVLCTAALTVVVIGLNAGWFPPASPRLAPRAMVPGRLAFFLFANASAIFLTAALASSLAEQLRATRERLDLKESDYLALEILQQSILRSIASGIVTADRFGRISFVNESARRVIGAETPVPRGTSILELFPQVGARLRGEPAIQRMEVDWSGADRVVRRLRFVVSPLLDEADRNHGWVIAFEDLTGLRAMEEAIQRSERLAAVGAMAAGLAHELRNPLASMSGSIQLLGDNKAFGDDERQLMGIVLREADRLNGLITDFLQFARPAPAQSEPVDLREVVEATVTLFRNDPTRRGIRVEVALGEPLPVLGDSGQLGQLLWNLLANAGDAMPDGGQVKLTGGREAGQVRLAVADTGVGIDPGDLPHIFDPFYTTKDSGTGLGLATVHGIVLAHGGRMLVDSLPGRGTTLTLELPERLDSQHPVAG